MMVEWWIIDTRSDRVVSVATTHGAPPRLDGLIVPVEHLRVTRTPTLAQQRAYRYWDERP